MEDAAQIDKPATGMLERSPAALLSVFVPKDVGEAMGMAEMENPSLSGGTGGVSD